MKERHLAVLYTHGSDKMKQFLNCQLDLMDQLRPQRPTGLPASCKC
jgi:hypothetical protein